MVIEELKKHGLYTGTFVFDKIADVPVRVDDVLPEYIILLVANRHSKEKIFADLEGLLSADFANGFTHWIFEELERLKSSESPIARVHSSFLPCGSRWEFHCVSARTARST
jgi:hypothetical protein